MFRPGGYGPQHRQGPSGTSVQGHPVPGPVMHGSGPGFSGGYQQNMGFGHPPAMPPQAYHASPGFTPIPYVENQGTPSLAPSYGTMASMQPLEPQHFPGPPPGQPLHGQPPRYPLPPPPNFTGTLLPGPPVNIQAPPLPLRPTFSPVLPTQPSSGNQLSQTFTSTHMVPQHVPQPPFLVGEVSQPFPPLHTLPEAIAQPPLPHTTFSVCQSSSSLHTQQFQLPESTPLQPASGTSQPPPASMDMSNPLPPSHLMNLPPPPQKPNDSEIVQNIEILSEFVVKNGPEFENMARARQAGNPKFAFLFNGPAGTDAAIGHQYFQWMKMKLELQMKNGQGAEDQGQSAEQSEPPLYAHQGTDPMFESQAALMSPALSDVDMEDDFAIAAMSIKDDKDLHSNNLAGISTLNEQENKYVSSNMILKATNSGEKEEVMPTNVAHMDFSQSELQGKEELSHLTFEQRRVEETTPVQSTGIEFQQITKNSANVPKQAFKYEGYENASSIEEQQTGSYVTPGSFNLVRNYQEMMPEDLAHGHVGLIRSESRTGFAGRNRENMEFDKFEHNKGQTFERNHVGNGLGEASIYVQDHNQPSSWTTDARQGHDYKIIEGKVPTEEGKERIGSPIDEGTSDSESDEVLYTANGLKRGRRSTSVQSPGNSRLRSCSQSPRRHRSRTRSPRRGCDTKDGEQEKGICLNFERGMCHEGSSCKFVHHKAGPNSIVDYSDEESEEGKCSKEMKQDLKGNNTSPGRKSDGHDNPVAREEKKHEVSKKDDSSGKGEKSIEWDLDFASESYSAYFDREIFQPSVLHREGSESQPLRRDDFRPLPLRKEDFEPQILSREDIPSQPFQREGLQPQPLQREGLHVQLLRGDDSLTHRLNREDGRTPLLLQREGLLLQPLRRDDMDPQFIRGEDSRARLLNREEGRPSMLLQEDMQRMHKQPFLQEDLRAKAFIQDDLRAHPLFHEDIRSRPLFREDVELSRDRARSESFSREYLHAPLLHEELHAHPLRREDVRSLPLLRGASSGQPLLRDDVQVPSLLADDLNRVKQLRRDILLDPFHRGNLRSKDEELQYRALLREEIRAQHLLREKSRLNADSFLPREDLYPRLLSREDARLKALARDFSSHQLDVSMGKTDPLLYRNPSIQKNIALPVNSSFSPHLDLIRTTGPSLLGHTSSFLNHPRGVSFLGECHTLHSEVPFRMNTNPLSQPDLVPSVPHTLPLHSPRNTSPQNIYRTGVQPTYRYSHDGGPFVPASSSLRGSTPGGPYDTRYDSTDPALRSKLFDFYRGEQLDPMGAVMVSDVRQQSVDVNHENDGGNAKTSAPVQPGNAMLNAKDSLKADYAVEAATDAEVGVVDNESPQLDGDREGSPGHHLDVATAGAGEIDVDQTHANDKTRNIKEIKAMKVFRTALAELAKELLKPTWREGHMSKEAFKLIVKKAVDKVAGTLQSHQIPNTQERIDQYLESSRVKFSKLVEGYVEKYVKV